MATIIKLTYTQTGRVTLVNLDQMTTAFRMFEKSTRKYATRINFQNDSFAIVDEELQTIKALGENALSGEFQDNDWVEVDAGTGEEFHDRLQNDFQNNYMHNRQDNRRPRQYHNNYNNRY
jgi:hypothetical protein